MTRDQLAQMLLVFIGTAADIIEFFDSFKARPFTIFQLSFEYLKSLFTNLQDEKVNTDKVLCILILSIWSWSLMQFTLVITGGKDGPPPRNPGNNFDALIRKWNLVSKWPGKKCALINSYI